MEVVSLCVLNRGIAGIAGAGDRNTTFKRKGDPGVLEGIPGAAVVEVSGSWGLEASCCSLGGRRGSVSARLSASRADWLPIVLL